MTKINNTSTPAEVVGRVKRKDGEKDFQGFKAWLNRQALPLKNLGKTFNDNFDEVFKEDKPFNLTRLKALFDGSIWNEVDEKINALIEGKDKALKAHYVEHYAGKKEEVLKAFDQFKEVFSNTVYNRSSIHEDSVIPSQFTTLDALPIIGDQLAIDPDKIQAMRPEFDVYSDDPLHVEMAELCEELADVYNRMMDNIKRRDDSNGLKRQHGGASEFFFLPLTDYFLRKKEDGLTVEANYNFIF